MIIRQWFGRVSSVLLFSLCAAAQQYTVTTVAGNATAGFTDGAASSAQFNLPGLIAVSSSGVIYVADPANQRVRKIADGTVSTVAGNGTAGFAGDKAAATAANLNSPAGVAVDSAGNVYIADSLNHVVRKVDTSGNITTFAGNASIGYGDGPDGAPATRALLDTPLAVCLDAAGNVYISDAGNGKIRKVNSAGILTTVVGNGNTSGALNKPYGIAFDAAGNLYIADTGNKRIAKYVFSGTNPLSTFAGNQTTGYSGDGGQARLARLNNPSSVAVDAAGNVYIADSVNYRIRQVAASGIITTIAGNGTLGYSGDAGPATSAQFSSPRGVALDSKGNLYVSDSGNSVIRVLKPSFPVVSDGGVTNTASYKAQISPGALATVFGTGFGALTQSAAPTYPANLGGISVNVNGKAAPLVYISPNQINFQVPWSTAVGSATVTVSVNGGASNSISVPVVAAGPGLFVSGDAAIAQNSADYSLNGPSNPAPGGSAIIAYLTGSGPLDIAQTDGVAAPATTLVSATSTCTATIGSANAKVLFCGLAPGFAGLVQVNVTVPSGLTPGAYPLTVTIGGQASNPGNVSVK